MKKLLVVVLVLGFLLSMTACKNSETLMGEVEKEAVEELVTEVEEVVEPETVQVDLTETLDFKINFVMGSTQRTMTYNQANPMTMPDGSIITSGDLKPVWQAIAKNVNITIDDVSIQDQKGGEMIKLAAATSFKEADIFGGSDTAQELMNYGTEGYFVDLAANLDKMPNFKAYLEANGTVKDAISSKEGGIFYIPYLSEIGNYARAFMCREDWVTLLLDGNTLENESSTLDVAYQAYWTGDKARNDSNVVELQNAAATNGTLSRDLALSVLVDYIKATYDYTNPSELFIGVNAQYDMDELVALLRVVRLSPNTLSKQATGQVVENAIISPLFWRASVYKEDAFRMINYFSGQRVYGADSYLSKLYIDHDGELQYSFAEDGFLSALDQLKGMYSEGLINKEFAESTNKIDFRSELISKDKEEGHTQFGFITQDWFASTSAASEEMVGMLPPVTTTPVSDGAFIHFMENTRTIKSDGWAISSNVTGEKLDRALYLFDYIFSREGQVLQNYGLDDMLVQGELYTGPDGIDYPKFDDWIFETARDTKDGDVSAFLRDFVGAQLAIGYPKEIGFEYQYTAQNGLDAWGLYEDAGVISPSYTAEEPFYRLAPTAFPLDNRDIAKLETTNIGDTQVDMVFQYILGGQDAVSLDQIKQNFIDSGLDTYLETYREVYHLTNK
jgi:hypothetical protein